MEDNKVPEMKQEPVENPVLPTEPPKKRRGRPPKNPNLNPENPGSPNTSTGPKKRAGKMSGEQIGSLAMQLQGIHAIAAAITNLPEVAIADAEAKALAESVANMAAQYNLSLDGKTGAAIQLLATAAMIYTPRYFSIKNRMSRPVTGNVVDITKSENVAAAG